MRPINTTTIQLQEFFDNQIPLYAILSHRWEGAEVTFQDLSAGKGMEMKGYAKILGCCAQARDDGFDFAWIDSCCIDKSSSAELSEAINSMFRWYHDAQVCYAYLSDVPAIEDLNHYRVNSEFRQSKWFTRGWTLQELLAPEIVVFYNHDWIEIGTKASINDLISSITSIEPRFLTGGIAVKHACVAQKMSWASKRKTTRLEDTAYCLMGLFDVNMPLLYGEGKKAFRRLQLEIIRGSSDESIFAWGSTRENVVPRLATAFHYGLLAEDPAMFEDSGDIEANYSFRPPYTMTTKGLQIDVNLVRRPEYTANARDKELCSDFIFTLHCHRRGDDSNHVGIYLAEGEEGMVWERVSDLLLSSNLSPQFKIDDKTTQSRQIIIKATRDGFDREPWRKKLLPFLLDVHSVMKYGYSISVWTNSDPRFELEQSGGSIHRFQSDRPKLSLLLECKKPQDDFRLVIRRYPEKSRKEGFYINLDGAPVNSLHGDRALLPSGKIVKLIVKRKAESGKPTCVLEIKIEKPAQLDNAGSLPNLTGFSRF